VTLKKKPSILAICPPENASAMAQFDFVVPTAVVIQMVLNAQNIVAPKQKSGATMVPWQI
jgi:hypothetical protein